jgi:hypothetical protein
MADISKELFEEFKVMMQPVDVISNTATHYLLFWDVGTTVGGEGMMFFDKTYLKDWSHKRKNHVIFGPINFLGKFEPTFYLNYSTYGKDWYIVKGI